MIYFPASHLWLSVLEKLQFNSTFVCENQKDVIYVTQNIICNFLGMRSHKQLLISTGSALSSFTNRWEKGDSWQREVIGSIDHAIRERLQQLQACKLSSETDKAKRFWERSEKM